MPSAASVKVEKPSTTNNSANIAVAAKDSAAQGENVDSPIRQISLIIEHKIRNLEKRKSKLESYRDLEKTGKDLSADKKVAILKYDEVAMTLEFAREFSKQIEKVVVTSEKDAKKKQKKDETLKNETSKIREVLIIQDMLRQLADETVRNDFLAGTNGACKLEESDLELLDNFASKVLPNRASLNGVTFKNACQKAAEHLALTIDGKQKDFEESTYANVKNLLKSIQKSGYFEKVDQSIKDTTESVDETENDNGNDDDAERIDETEQLATAKTDLSTTNVGRQAANVNILSGTPEVLIEQTNKIEAPSASAVPVPTFAQQQQQLPQQPHIAGAPVINAAKNFKPLPQTAASPVAVAAGAIPLAQVPPPGHQIHAGVVQPTTVRAVEQAYFKQHQYIQQMRPLAEVLGSGNFFFLQDSELDSPDVPNNNVAPHQTSDRQPNVQIGQPPSQSPSQGQPPHSTGVESNQFFPMIHNPQSNSFPNVVAPNHQQSHQLQQPQQPHIPGFASSTAIPIPIPAAAAAAAQIPVAQSVQQQATSNTSSNSNQLLTQNQQQQQPKQQPFPTATKFVNQTNISENSSHDLHSNSSDLNEHGNDLKNFASNRTIGNNGNGNVWRDPYNSNKGSPESNEWNGIPNENGHHDESNTWASGSSSNQRYNQYRQGSGNYRSSNNKTTFSKNPTNGYRGSGNYRPSSNKTTFNKNPTNGYRGSGNNNNYRPSSSKTTFSKNNTTNGYRA